MAPRFCPPPQSSSRSPVRSAPTIEVKRQARSSESARTNAADVLAVPTRISRRAGGSTEGQCPRPGGRPGLAGQSFVECTHVLRTCVLSVRSLTAPSRTPRREHICSYRILCRTATRPGGGWTQLPSQVAASPPRGDLFNQPASGAIHWTVWKSPPGTVRQSCRVGSSRAGRMIAIGSLHSAPRYTETRGRTASSTSRSSSTTKRNFKR